MGKKSPKADPEKTLDEIPEAALEPKPKAAAAKAEPAARKAPAPAPKAAPAPAPKKPTIPLRVFRQIHGAKMDQLAGFTSYAKRQKLGPMTVPEWREAYTAFMNRPIR